MRKYPILFESTAKRFRNNGIGVLSDAVQCNVTEETNGVFELSMIYTGTGAFAKEIVNNRIVLADTGKELGEQPFRIARVNKLASEMINVYAQHISYDLSGIQLPPFEANNPDDAMSKISEYSTSENPFTFSSMVYFDGTDDANKLTTKTPKSVRSYLVGAKESILQKYGGEFVFNTFYVRHVLSRGSQKALNVKYGVNLVDMNQEQSIERTVTGIYPYYKDEYMFMDLTESYDLMYPHEIDTSKLDGKILYAEGDFPKQKIASVDLSPLFEVAPLSTDELLEVAQKYMQENKIGIPDVSLDVQFESLAQFAEYQNQPIQDDVILGTPVNVIFQSLGVESTGRINRIIYDALRHKPIRVSLGDAKSNVADTLFSIQNQSMQSSAALAGLSKSIAKIDVSTTQNAARIDLLVQTDEQGENIVRGEILVEAINGQSEATISADKVNLKGYVTVSSLQEGGNTVIDGSRIQTGSIYSQNFADTHYLIKSYATEEIPPSTYSFSLDDSTFYYQFETSVSIPIGGSVVFYPSSNKIFTYEKSGNLLEELNVTISNIPVNIFRVDGSTWFSDAGTRFDLENGEIISSQFAIKKDGSAYFGGEVNVQNGYIGVFQLSKTLGLAGYTSWGGGSSYGAGYFFFSSDSKKSVSAVFGDFLPSPLGDPNHITFENVNGDRMNITESNASLIGKWKATPYKDPTKEVSEIVTKQDLIDLGLINA